MRVQSLLAVAVCVLGDSVLASPSRQHPEVARETMLEAGELLLAKVLDLFDAKAV